MKLNRHIPYSTLYEGDSRKCSELAFRLPDPKCLAMPNIVVMEHSGEYFVVKSRWEIEGDPYNSGRAVSNPYDLEYNEFTLAQIRAACNPNTNYQLPEGFVQQNVLIRVE